MNALLSKVLDAHGGLERWKRYTKVQASGLKSPNERRSRDARSFIRSANAMLSDKVPISTMAGRAIDFLIVIISNPRELRFPSRHDAMWAIVHVIRNADGLWSPCSRLIPTLIITDIDTVDENGQKCAVADGKATSNAALKGWTEPPRHSRDLRLQAQ